MNRSNLVQIGKMLLAEIEPVEGSQRQGLLETPDRFAKAVEHWFSGYQQDPAATLKAFEDGSEGYDQMVHQCNIPVWSHCEHHIAPFFGVAHIAYIPKDRVVGLSKLTRLVNIFSRRLQVQERLTNQIADALAEHVSKNCGVILECRHTCMESRGVQTAGTTTTTSAMRGVFLHEASTKAEFMTLALRR